MNWPLAADGTPAAALTAAPGTRRVWSRFARRDDVFRRNHAAVCPDSADATVYTRDLAQVDGTVLIDRSGNFTVYETRLNPVAEAYIRDNALDSRAGQAAFDPQPVEFPHARIAGEAATPPQIVRCWDLMEGTRAVNAIWQARLSGSVLHNYMPVSSQWRGANNSPIFPNGELPRFLTNTTVETFAQTDPQGTCLGCHTTARTATGADANFTFLLGAAE